MCLFTEYGGGGSARVLAARWRAPFSTAGPIARAAGLSREDYEQHWAFRRAEVTREGEGAGQRKGAWPRTWAWHCARVRDCPLNPPTRSFVALPRQILSLEEFSNNHSEALMWKQAPCDILVNILVQLPLCSTLHIPTSQWKSCIFIQILSLFLLHLIYF